MIRGGRACPRRPRLFAYVARRDSAVIEFDCPRTYRRAVTSLIQTLGALSVRASAFAARLLHRDVGEEEGQGMVEYALILLLIAVVVIVVLTVVGGTTSNVFSNVSTGLGT